MMWFLQMAQLSTTMSENIYRFKKIRDKIVTYHVWHKKTLLTPCPQSNSIPLRWKRKKWSVSKKKRTLQKVARYEKERLRNTFTFLTSNLFLLEPEEVDGTAGESTSIPSGSAIFLLCWLLWFTQAQRLGIFASLLCSQAFTIQDVCLGVEKRVYLYWRVTMSSMCFCSFKANL